MKRVVLLVALAVMLGGCATNHVSVDENGGVIAWEGEKSAMLGEMKNSFAQVFPGRNIFPIGDSGFYTWQRFMMDKQTHEAVLLPFDAKDDTGEKIEAYSLNVTSGGTMMNGPSKNRELFENIMAKLNALFRRASGG